jgi:WD40 repeat protein
MVLKSATGAGNPFPGLRPFLSDDRNMFFGRESESGEILKKLLKNRILTVIGPLGSGKSSVVNCGVVPEMIRLTEQDNNSLKIVLFQPGTDPVANMTNAFTQAFSGNDDVEKRDISFISHPKKDSDWLTATVKKLMIKPDGKVLIIIDQFEDIFTCNSNEADVTGSNSNSEFVAMLENAINQTSADVYLLNVIRSEYIGDCANIRGLTNLINSSSYLLPQMTPGNFRSVLENSFLSAGARIDSNLVIRIMDDLSFQINPLAVLQHLMMRTFAYWGSLGDPARPVGISDYEVVGTIRNALSKHAEEVYEELNQDEKEICRKMFRAMTGYKVDIKKIRPPLNISTLKAIVQCSDNELFQVIEKFRAPGRSFLTPDYKIPLDEKSVIDFSTESLISIWDRLKGWVEDELSSARMYLKLSEASGMFQKGKANLLKDSDLKLAVKWRENQRPTLSWAERYDPAFERVMVYLRTSEKAYHEKYEIKARKHLKKIKKKRITAFILGSALILSLGFMLIAVVQKVASDRLRSEADRQKAIAVAKITIAEQKVLNAGKQTSVSDSNALVASQKEREALKLAESYNNQKEVAESNANEAIKQLSLVVAQSDSERKKAITADLKAAKAIEQKMVAEHQRMISLSKSMALKSQQLSGQKDLQALLAYQAYIFNKSNGGAANDDDIFSGLYNIAKLYGNIYCKTFTGHVGDIKNIAFVPGKNEFFTSGSDGKVIKWDLNGKNQNLQVVYSGTEIIEVLAVSPDAGWLACGGQNSGIKLVSIKSNDPSFELKGHTGAIKSLIFSYDGRYLYSASSDGNVLKWDLASRNYTDISSSMMRVTSIDLSTDNKYIAGVSNDGKVLVWNPEAINDNFRIGAPGKVIRTVKFKPDEKVLAIGYSDGYIDMWDIAARKKVSEIKAHDSEVISIRFNNKLSQMATAGDDKAIRLWDMNDMSRLPISFNDNEGLVFTIEFSPDGQVLVTGTSEGRNNLTSRPVLADMLSKNICSTISRNFTVEEWQAYVGKDIEYEKTCPESDFKIRVNPVK